MGSKGGNGGRRFLEWFNPLQKSDFFSDYTWNFCCLEQQICQNVINASINKPVLTGLTWEIYDFDVSQNGTSLWQNNCKLYPCQARMAVALASAIGKLSGTKRFGIFSRTEAATAGFQVPLNIWNKFMRAASVPGGNDLAVKYLFWLIELCRQDWSETTILPNMRWQYEVTAVREASALLVVGSCGSSGPSPCWTSFLNCLC